MCVAIALPARRLLDEQIINACWQVSPDGAGYGFYKDENTPILNKGFFALKDFLEAFKKDREENIDKPFLVHFRNRTHGIISTDNCHPFQLDEGMMIHNGYISGANAGTTGPSDSAILASWLKPVPAEEYGPLAEQLTGYLGWNAVALLNKKDQIHLAGQNKGVNFREIWFSNDQWKWVYDRNVAKEERERTSASNSGKTDASTPENKVLNPSGELTDEEVAECYAQYHAGNRFWPDE